MVTQIANSQGLARAVLFTGLSHPMLLHPILHGEPVLTAQAFYYLDELEAVATIRFESGMDELDEGDLEYLIDNYLFEFSKLNPESKITTKVEQARFWNDDPSGFYRDTDLRHTQSLTVDSLNDPDVHSIAAEDPDDRTDLQDWDIGKNYADDCLRAYLDALTAALEKKVVVTISPSNSRPGYRGKLRVLKADDGLIDFWQASALANISIRQIDPSTKRIPLPASSCRCTRNDLSLEQITGAKQHSPLLLSHYFSGLKESNPLKAFVGFYNVLEYYFDDAGSLLGRAPAQSERLQLEHVVDFVTTSSDVTNLIASLSPTAQQRLFADILTASGVAIRGLDVRTDVLADLSRWLYDIRCAIVHSKKTRRGRPTPSFEPYSRSSNALRVVIPVIQWLAVQCIEKDHWLVNSNPTRV
ncbi:MULTISPECIES: hypothetical protein [unclassified Bradyrhizobium]|uniref:hypothetical protein n=1 Tax=unclassified Bradyrhizobium TaxID=2631580 RepID=UPI0024E04B02|nr:MULTISPECIES: hypothetical protein [unclassified Bradyrhizobium]